MKCVRNISKNMEEMNGDGDIQVGFSGVVERRDHNLSEKLKNNESLKKYCNSKGFFIDK